MPGMTGTLRACYDGLAADYTLFTTPSLPTGPRPSGARAKVLDRLIQTTLGAGTRTVLDAACGIGTQAIGLALRGHLVHGTDLSPAAVDRAAQD